VEAKPGDTIEMVKAASMRSYAYKPNVVLINAGTNDCNRNITISEAGQRMRSLIEGLLNAPDMSEALIVLSTLLPSGNDNIKTNTPAVNEQYRDLVNTMRGEGVSIVLAEMNGDVPFILYPEEFTTNGQVDDTHPNDAGYLKMASVWYAAIMNAASQDLVRNPVALDGPSTGGGSGTCEKEYGDGIYAGITQRGSGEEDGIYYHDSRAMGEVGSFVGDKEDFNRVFFARIFSRDRDDLLVWRQETDGADVEYSLFRNANGQFEDYVSLSVGDNCNPAGVNFIDINGWLYPLLLPRLSSLLHNVTSG
jgi:hypothetical protein